MQSAKKGRAALGFGRCRLRSHTARREPGRYAQGSQPRVRARTLSRGRLGRGGERAGESPRGFGRGHPTKRARARDFRCAAAPSHPAPRFVLISIARRRKPRSRAGSRARASSEGGGHVGSTLTFSLSSLAARASPRAQVHNAAATGRAGFNPRAWRGVRGFVPRLEPRGDQNQHHEGAIVDKRPK